MTREELEALIQASVVQATQTYKEEEDEARKADHETFRTEMEAQLAELKKPVNRKEIPAGTESDEDPTFGWDGIASFAKAVATAEKTHGRNVDQRLQDAIKKTTMSEGDSTQGGYLVPTEFRNELLQIAVEKAEILNRARAVPMAMNAIQFPYISGFDHSGGVIHGGVEFVWLDEEGTKTEKKPTVGKVELRLKKCAAICRVTDELLDDSPISIEPLLREAFTDALAWQLDWVFLNGSGAGQPQGILNAPALIPVAKETGQAATTIVWENIIKMYSRLWRKSSGVWFINHDCLPQLTSMGIAVGTGGVPVYMPANGASGKPYDTLMGLPIAWSEHCQTLGTVGDIYLVDWSQYLVGQKAGAGGALKFDTSIHLYFTTDETAFRFVYRIDGQPWWPSALTPRYSSDTLSPFVALATRA